MTHPPKPRHAPSNGSPQAQKNIHKTRVGGGFNPTLQFTVAGQQPGPSAPGTPAGGSGSGGKIPGSDFMSNEDIRAFCEYLRKQARNRATERAMDADHLEAVLKTIPDLGGSLGGARARARRVSRWMKKIAAAEKNIQKYAASVYATFEREYESDLRKIGKGRSQQRPTTKFGWR
ncbi:plasmid transfer protein TraA [Streptomyces sp. NPDC015131]|uniref:plasmid transfer protein TraA n=1 Tax=Streptomyces sp. NPDC015131 TaxID=3364941 RepID=UPI0036F775F9